MDEIFGLKNFISIIAFKKTHYLESDNVSNIADFLVLFAKDISKNKHRKAFRPANLFEVDYSKYTRAFTPNGNQPIPKEWREDPSLFERNWRPFRSDITLTQDGDSGNSQVPWELAGKTYFPGAGRHWRTNEKGRSRLFKAGRVNPSLSRPFYIEGFDDSPSTNSSNIWTENLAGAQGKVYIVQTNERVVERCILMTTDPGDLVLDPTCGSGTTAFVAEQWGRRWITIDTSRVAVALARSRLMGGRYPYYLLADSPEGQRKEGEVTRQPPKTSATHGDIRHGFVYERVPHIMLKDIANNVEIDVLYEKWAPSLTDALECLNSALDGHATPYPISIGGRAGQKVDFRAAGMTKLPTGEEVSDNRLLEWEVPREAPKDWPTASHAPLKDFWDARIARQKEIDASIAARAEFEYLYDRPYEDKAKIRVAGPFTVESLSPHRTLAVGADDELIDPLKARSDEGAPTARDATARDFTQMIIENLRISGVQQMEKGDKIAFTGVTAWPGGGYICAEGQYMEGSEIRRAAIFVGPEFGSVSRADLVAAAKQAADEKFDVLIACAFNYDAASTEFDRMGRIRVLKARMNPDLLMAKDLKTTATGNLFVVFGEPDVDLERLADATYRVKVHGVDVFKPQTGEVTSSGTDGIALWMIDTDYNEESFFVRHAYFLGANDPYKALKTTLKAEIDEEAWQSLYSDTSRPFPKPSTGRIAVKVINHLGDEVMKVMRVS